jgi:hypothetical protein
MGVIFLAEVVEFLDSVSLHTYFYCMFYRLLFFKMAMLFYLDIWSKLPFEMGEKGFDAIM